MLYDKYQLYFNIGNWKFLSLTQKVYDYRALPFYFQENPEIP